MLAHYSMKREDNGEITSRRSKSFMSFNIASKMAKCVDAIKHSQSNEKQVRFKAK